ncbi:3'(2'),5'-bisphosphate nucleotidase CysQ [Paraburkholderia sp. MM5482-R1]|uniref:3'(2'),5'-bisphosphate nucleotidase CysQ n=1 Tax=unclassified Paraburkholderia TaxID=2615204 RepID=UPI003D24CFA9
MIEQEDALSVDASTLDRFEQLAIAAAEKILEYFDNRCPVWAKADRSPVTEADHAAEAVIVDGLRAVYRGVPCVAEEAVSAGVMPNVLGRAFFLIDPLDGTKEFIAGRNDFTVNIALIRDGTPLIGVVLAPATRMLYSGRPGYACMSEVGADRGIRNRQRIAVRARCEPPTIVASRSHASADTDEFIQRYPDAKCVSVGSSLKFCAIASGAADIYPRLGRTMEWDTAAGHAVLSAAGGRVMSMDGTVLTYGKRGQSSDVDFANPWFVAEGGPSGSI